VADVARAARLANPELGDCKLLSDRLRAQKAELTRTRSEVAARAQVDFALARSSEAQAAVLRIRALDRELGSTEDALDRVHDLLRPGAEKRHEQRTRSAALAIADRRVVAVKALLVELGVDPARIQVRNFKARATAGEDGGRVRACVHRIDS
jgi:hypothetical protein